MKRNRFLEKIQLQFEVHSVCALLGPRQVGKTTLAKMYIQEHYPDGGVLFFDLENPADLMRLENPMLALSYSSNRLIVIDEIQKRPELFPILRVLVDEVGNKRKFLILGSASRDLIHQSSETLAGRIGYIELTPFSLREVEESTKLWLRGGFPSSYLAKGEQQSYLWRQSYITTFLERDIPQLGIQIPATQLRRFWLMISHCHGQILNMAEIGRSLQISDQTVRRYLDILVGTFMVRLLTPWYENLGKRQVKAPKIYMRDSGILHTLTGIKEMESLQSSPKLGAFWEGFALEEIIRMFQATSEECYFWATHSGAELDLFLCQDGKRLGFECRYSDAPRSSASMYTALTDLKLDHLYVITPGNRHYPIDTKITVLGLDLASSILCPT